MLKIKIIFVDKKYSYNTFSFLIFSVLIVGTVSFFAFADDEGNLTLFEDFDRDGISNEEEVVFGTNPDNADTDGDGYSDGVEIESGYDPLISAPGDRIVKAKSMNIESLELKSDNVTRNITADVVSFLSDAQEAGDEDITAEELTQVVSNAVDEEMSFDPVTPVDESQIKIKKQNYNNLSSKKANEKKKEDAIEYLTAVSYIFISNFPNGFFSDGVEALHADILTQIAQFSQSLEQYSFFEDIAKNSIEAKKQMNDIEVPEDFYDLHTEGLYLLQYIEDVYEREDYKNANTDIAPMILTLVQTNDILNKGINFQESLQQKLEEYDIKNVFLDL